MRPHARYAFSVLALISAASLAQETVDDAGTARGGKVGSWPSICTADGDTAVAYFCERDYFPDATQYTLRFAWRTPSGWLHHTFDPEIGGLNAGAGGSWAQLARDDNGTYHIVTYSNTALRWATGSGTNWTVSPQPVDHGLIYPTHVSMALDASGFPHVIYMESDADSPHNIYYTRWDGAAWVRGPAQLVASNTTNGSSAGGDQLALDPSGTPHVVYIDSPNFGSGPVHLRTLSGSTWTDLVVGTNAYDAKIALDQDGDIHLVYSGPSGLIHAARQAGAWSTETITPEFGTSLGLCLDEAGSPVVSFRSGDSAAIAERTVDGWVVSPAETAPPSMVMGGIGTDVAIDANGMPVVAYGSMTYDGTGWFIQDLKISPPNPACINIISHPQDAITCTDSTANFSVFSSGQGSMGYVWQGTSDGVDWFDLIDGEVEVDEYGSIEIAGASTARLTVSAFVDDDGNRFDLFPISVRCIVQSYCGQATSEPADLIVCPVDYTCDGALNFFDVAGFLDAFNNLDPAADLSAPNGSFDFFDVAEFLSLFNHGCR
jgi:hypothetical protein